MDIRPIVIALTLFCFSSPAFAVGILWFGAHPDDEGAISSVMAKYCTTTGEQGKYPCRMVVMTKGEGGTCEGLPQAEREQRCPNFSGVAAVRTEEMRNAALYLHSSLVQWSFTNQHHPNTTWDEPVDRWSKEAKLIGGLNAIKTAIKNEILKFNPHVIITFDPRQGATCHQEHRSIGALVTVSADELGFPPGSVLYPENAPWEGKGSNNETIWLGNKNLVDSDLNVGSEDVSTFLPNYGKSAWAAKIEEAQIHRSQNTKPELYPLIANAPVQAQREFYLQRNLVASGDSRYESICPVIYP